MSVLFAICRIRQLRPVACLLVLAAVWRPAFLPAQPPALPTRLFMAASAVSPALADVRTLPPGVRHGVRYLSCYSALPADLPAWQQTLAHVVNSLSRRNIIILPPVVPGTEGRLYRVVLSEYHIDPREWDRLAEEGSGRSPFPDPYFHLTVERDHEYGYYQDGYGRHLPASTPAAERQGYTWHTTRTTHSTELVQPPWLPRTDLLALVAETHSESPILRADWFSYYALLEPAYHRFLGFEDEREFDRLAGAEPVKEEEETIELGSVVLNSEVAGNNRALFRTASRLRHGRGYLWESRDFDKSIQADDVLQDPSVIVARAKEKIGSLPNGLQFFGVFDARGKRLDRAGIEFAHDSRNGFRSVEVEIRNCLCCHAQGIIAVDDAVRGYASGQVALALRQLREKDEKKARFVADRYFSTSINDLIQSDQQNYAAAVRGCNGLDASANALQLRRLLLGYERMRRLDELALDTGYPAAVVKGVIERAQGTGLHHSVVGVLTKKGETRYDQYAAQGHSQLMQLLLTVPVDAPPPAAPPRGRGERATARNYP